MSVFYNRNAKNETVDASEYLNMYVQDYKCLKKHMF